MFRKLSLVVVAGLFLSLSARGQGVTDKIDIYGGYSFMHFDSSPSFNTNGWELGGQYKVMPWLGAAADVDGHYGTFEGVNSTLHNFLFGPQVSFPARVSPFAHVLVGGARINADGPTSNSFAYAFGFGIDTKVAPQIAWRIVQIDFVHTHLFGEAETNSRIGTGIVIHF
jgi:hypothetical protein